MAGTCSSFTRHVIGSATVELSRIATRGGGASRISTKSIGASASAEGPSCIYVGPIETASKETLEALYRQARDAYYSGEPLIVDDMFDRVELKLRWYGSKSVLKYPRCSIRRQSTYADAEVDMSQVFALASIWIVFLVFGSLVVVGPIIYTVVVAYQDAYGSGISHGNQASMIQFLATLNAILFMAVGSLIGYPIASASVKVLQGLWRNDLVGLKGACPNCGEEVFAFVKSDESNDSPHRADCHVCESLLEFRTKVEGLKEELKPKNEDQLKNFSQESGDSRLGRRWVHGRIYLVSRRRQRWKKDLF
ncbi:hypothetical protein M5689_002735 [Euphorbia peplus]|nr:hypothetical protein M5689_002735 [Euphorbia peplus]